MLALQLETCVTTPKEGKKNGYIICECDVRIRYPFFGVVQSRDTGLYLQPIHFKLYKNTLFSIKSGNRMTGTELAPVCPASLVPVVLCTVVIDNKAFYIMQNI